MTEKIVYGDDNSEQKQLPFIVKLCVILVIWRHAYFTAIVL